MSQLLLSLFAAMLAVVWPARLTLDSPALPTPESYKAELSQPGGQTLTLNVDGASRQFLLYLPATEVPESGAPLVLIFHGHSSTMREAAVGFRVHEQWPAAVVVYPQGLTGVGVLTDPEGRFPGWQNDPGDQGDRDVRFVDETLTLLQRELAIDPNRIYAFGHSNGARFVNVLWNQRGETYAAFASAASQGGLLIRDAVPRSLFMLMGEEDDIVPYRTQALSIPIARETLQTDRSQLVIRGPVYSEPGLLGTELAILVHPGGHDVPSETIPLIVEFFERNPRP
jgi:polyhydroxybutyrate depolymerase